MSNGDALQSRGARNKTAISSSGDVETFCTFQNSFVTLSPTSVDCTPVCLTKEVLAREHHQLFEECKPHEPLSSFEASLNFILG